jgi:hypothetical protein
VLTLLFPLKSPDRSRCETATPLVFVCEIVDVLMAGEKAVGAIVDGLSMSPPQVSSTPRVLSEAGLVRCRAQSVVGGSTWNPRASGRCTDRLDDDLKSHNDKEIGSDT